MANELTAISFKLPTALREKIRIQAAAEERSEAGFLRYHLGQLFAMSEDETSADDDEPQTVTADA